MKLILASSSPRRKKILHRLGYPFDIVLPKVEESLLTTKIEPGNYCSSLAKMKADYVSNKYPHALVIGADTIVFLKKQILNKPINNYQAKKMLSLLSGETHRVYTGICLMWKTKNIEHTFTEITQVSFRDLNDKEILYYINNYHTHDKAGAYGIQDISAIFVKSIKGCYDNVVGFPLSRLYLELKKLDINLLDTISEIS